VVDLAQFLFTYLIVDALTITAVEYERLQRRLSIVPLHSTGPKRGNGPIWKTRVRSLTFLFLERLGIKKMARLIGHIVGGSRG
jgi:hypothetical protein